MDERVKIPCVRFDRVCRLITAGMFKFALAGNERRRAGRCMLSGRFLCMVIVWRQCSAVRSRKAHRRREGECGVLEVQSMQLAGGRYQDH